MEIDSQPSQLASPDQKQCKMCDKWIDAVKFRLHDIMCHKMNYRCKECNMVVPKSEKQYHDEEVCGKPQEPSPISVSEQKDDQANQASIQDQVGSSLIEEEKFDPSKMAGGKPLSAPEDPYKNMTQEEIAEANRREIERIQEEQLNEMLAAELQEEQNKQDVNAPMSNYEKSKLKTMENKQLYGEDPSQWPEGVRPADQNKFQSLYDDDQGMDVQHQDYEGNVFDQADEFGGINQIMGQNMPGTHLNNNMSIVGQNVLRNGVFSAQQNFGGGMGASRSNEEIKGPEINEGSLPQNFGDNNEDQIDFQGQSEQEQIEEQLLQQILEQSKNDQ